LSFRVIGLLDNPAKAPERGAPGAHALLAGAGIVD